MSDERHTSRRIRMLVALWALGGLVACDSGQLPDGLSLQITPENRTYEVLEQRTADGRCLYHDSFYLDVPLLLVARDGQGTPLGGVEVSLYADFTDSLFEGLAVLALYRDVNDNGLIDEADELMSATQSEVPRIITDTDTGNDTALLRVNLTCGFRSEILAVAGHASASATIAVVAINEDPVEPEVDGTAEPVHVQGVLR